MRSKLKSLKTHESVFSGQRDMRGAFAAGVVESTIIQQVR
jgi:hypothetical protein